MEKKSYDLKRVETCLKSGDVSKALGKLNQWRVDHIRDLQVIKSIIWHNFDKRPENIHIFGRIKPVKSIIRKLNQFPSLQLRKMQDIAGIRVIARTETEMNTVAQFIIHKFQQGIVKVNDHRLATRFDGSRGMFVILKSPTDKLVEIQIQTNMQAAYTQTIETLVDQLDMEQYNEENSDLVNTAELLQTLMFTGAKISRLDMETEEEQNTYKQYAEEWLDNYKQLRQTECWKVMKGTRPNHFACCYDISPYAILYRTCRNVTHYEKFSKTDHETALARYIDIEYNRTADAILVSVSNQKDLKNCYPNYFCDFSRMIRLLEKLSNLYQKRIEEITDL